MKIVAYIAAGLAGLFLLLVLYEAIKGPPSLTEVAEEHARECIREKGYGAWLGSNGISLADFCKGVGAAKTLLDDRRANPERY